MKLSKSLIQAILVGVTLGTAESCTKTALIPEEQTHKCTTECPEKCSPATNVPEPVFTDPCPACGMG